MPNKMVNNFQPLPRNLWGIVYRSAAEQFQLLERHGPAIVQNLDLEKLCINAKEQKQFELLIHHASNKISNYQYKILLEHALNEPNSNIKGPILNLLLECKHFWQNLTEEMILILKRKIDIFTPYQWQLLLKNLAKSEKLKSAALKEWAISCLKSVGHLDEIPQDILIYFSAEELENLMTLPRLDASTRTLLLAAYSYSEAKPAKKEEIYAKYVKDLMQECLLCPQPLSENFWDFWLDGIGRLKPNQISALLNHLISNSDLDDILKHKVLPVEVINLFFAHEYKITLEQFVQFMNWPNVDKTIKSGWLSICIDDYFNDDTKVTKDAENANDEDTNDTVDATDVVDQLITSCKDSLDTKSLHHLMSIPKVSPSIQRKILTHIKADLDLFVNAPISLIRDLFLDDVKNIPEHAYSYLFVSKHIDKLIADQDPLLVKISDDLLWFVSIDTIYWSDKFNQTFIKLIAKVKDNDHLLQGVLNNKRINSLELILEIIECLDGKPISKEIVKHWSFGNTSQYPWTKATFHKALSLAVTDEQLQEITNNFSSEFFYCNLDGITSRISTYSGFKKLYKALNFQEKEKWIEELIDREWSNQAKAIFKDPPSRIGLISQLVKLEPFKPQRLDAIFARSSSAAEFYQLFNVLNDDQQDAWIDHFLEQLPTNNNAHHLLKLIFSEPHDHKKDRIYIKMLSSESVILYCQNDRMLFNQVIKLIEDSIDHDLFSLQQKLITQIKEKAYTEEEFTHQLENMSILSEDEIPLGITTDSRIDLQQSIQARKLIELAYAAIHSPHLSHFIEPLLEKVTTEDAFFQIFQWLDQNKQNAWLEKLMAEEQVSPLIACLLAKLDIPKYLSFAEPIYECLLSDKHFEKLCQNEKPLLIKIVKDLKALLQNTPIGYDKRQSWIDKFKALLHLIKKDEQQRQELLTVFTQDKKSLLTLYSVYGEEFFEVAIHASTDQQLIDIITFCLEDRKRRQGIQPLLEKIKTEDGFHKIFGLLDRNEKNAWLDKLVAQEPISPWITQIISEKLDGKEDSKLSVFTYECLLSDTNFEKLCQNEKPLLVKMAKDIMMLIEDTGDKPEFWQDKFKALLIQIKENDEQVHELLQALKPTPKLLLILSQTLNEGFAEKYSDIISQWPFSFKQCGYDEFAAAGKLACTDQQLLDLIKLTTRLPDLKRGITPLLEKVKTKEGFYDIIPLLDDANQSAWLEKLTAEKQVSPWIIHLLSTDEALPLSERSYECLLSDGHLDKLYQSEKSLLVKIAKDLMPVIHHHPNPEFWQDKFKALLERIKNDEEQMKKLLKEFKPHPKLLLALFQTFDAVFFEIHSNIISAWSFSFNQCELEEFNAAVELARTDRQLIDLIQLTTGSPNLKQSIDPLLEKVKTENGFYEVFSKLNKEKQNEWLEKLMAEEPVSPWIARLLSEKLDLTGRLPLSEHSYVYLLDDKHIAKLCQIEKFSLSKITKDLMMLIRQRSNPEFWHGRFKALVEQIKDNEKQVKELLQALTPNPQLLLILYQTLGKGFSVKYTDIVKQWSFSFNQWVNKNEESIVALEIARTSQQIQAVANTSNINRKLLLENASTFEKFIKVLKKFNHKQQEDWLEEAEEQPVSAINLTPTQQQLLEALQPFKLHTYSHAVKSAQGKHKYDDVAKTSFEIYKKLQALIMANTPIKTIHDESKRLIADANLTLRTHRGSAQAIADFFTVLVSLTGIGTIISISHYAKTGNWRLFNVKPTTLTLANQFEEDIGALNVEAPKAQ